MEVDEGPCPVQLSEKAQTRTPGTESKRRDRKRPGWHDDFVRDYCVEDKLADKPVLANGEKLRAGENKKGHVHGESAPARRRPAREDSKKTQRTIIDVESLADDDQECVREIASALSRFGKVLGLREVSSFTHDLASMVSAGLREGSSLEDLFEVGCVFYVYSLHHSK